MDIRNALAINVSAAVGVTQIAAAPGVTTTDVNFRCGQSTDDGSLGVLLWLKSILKPSVLGRAINRVLLRACVEQVLALVLSPGDVVVMDDLGRHKGDGVRELIAAAGAEVACWSLPSTSIISAVPD